jgi:type I restriction enzyme M protein
MGSSTKYADIGVFEPSQKSSPKLLVEAKKPDRTEGVDQLESYLEASGVCLGVWTNGDGIDYFHRPEPQKLEPISDIPRHGETLASMDSRVTRDDLSPASNLVSIFEQCEDEILAHQGGMDVFDELFKIILTKLYDEVENLHSADSVAEFRAGPTEDPTAVAERIRVQFQGSNDRDVLGAKRKYSDVFRGDEDILLNDGNIKRVVSTLQNIDFMNTDMDTLGAGFEALVPDQMKNEKGQYFTPRHVIRMTTELADPKRYENLLDPACGSGGFLVYVMRHLRDEIASDRGGDTDADQNALELVQEYASDRAHGLDYDQRLVRVAKAYMVIWGDGRTNIRHVNDSLRYFNWPGEIEVLVPENKFDVILTNPPFGGNIDIQNTRDYFDLASKNGSQLNTQEKDILFLERCIKHLKPGGRLGIVLPKGDLDERGKEYFRDYTYIRAVIGLHENTFLPYAGETTAVLLLEKKREPGLIGDEDGYPIFMAVSERPGKNNEGEHVHLRNDQEEIVSDESGIPRWTLTCTQLQTTFILPVSPISGTM